MARRNTNTPAVLREREITTHIVPGAPGRVQVFALDEDSDGICTEYEIRGRSNNGEQVVNLRITFQSGDQAAGPNGVTNEALLAIVLDRLERFQQADQPCKENRKAIYHLNEGAEQLARRITRLHVPGDDL